ncbi:ATP-binding component of an ABC superfamily outer membrane-specific lipoprotein transporter [Wigglesworthia glossinidia endosymbiont of Glossina morsitans morsitans (Yale colony)]|uniref:Lipoprotein-releasing system ATP-binding protein LolD n=1 Tax=Wigglesworthia glossinidia endosymbiont of Glossina morsitans morsitans (Yale colony) TaxID=1142511 RepID=H6Q5R2_WIGGL|nr:lipoprotein-releasing ABC transporter ATP-binding protein LolD [Wigglesworthia glossinidia]AFA40967.1 ATP-binding component of an ABC superfamily outer membrane-specific lipoprotein transporter [Wigglesworthia glossinidia endosymbiont of Glossina morsitans morsitans (Yale colony)]
MNKIPILSCVNVTKIYKNKLIILNNINLSIQRSETIAIVGRSGSGKSTLLYILSGLDNPTKGDVFFEGKSIYRLSSSQSADLRNKSFGFIYQFHHLLPDFNVLENVLMPALIGKFNIKNAKKSAYEILEQLGLQKRVHYKPHELSGGEKQRVAIARALINNPKIIFADEPTGNLDQISAKKFFALLNTINLYKSTTFLVVTHCLNFSKKLKKVLEIKNGILYKKDF